MNPSQAANAARRLTATDRRLRILLTAPASQRSSSIAGIVESASATVELALGAVPASGSCFAEMTELVSESLRLQHELESYLTTRHDGTLKRLSTSLRQLGAPTKGRTFPEQLCLELVSVARFEVAVFSTLSGGSLRPLAAATSDGSGSPGTLTAIDLLAGLAGDHHLLPDGEPVHSNDYSSDSATTSLLGTCSRPLTAPIAVGDLAAGTIHAGYTSGIDVDDTDVQIFGVYQRAASGALAREIWIRKARQHNQAVHETAAELISTTSRAVSAELEFGDFQDLGGCPGMDQSFPENSELEALLTNREAEVLRLIAVGSSNAEIADHLFIGIETVKSHVKKVLRKIGAVNRSEAISLYLDHG